jgi:multidrug efflux pump subunit AcrB
MNGRQYEVIAQVERSKRTEPVDIGRIYVRNSAGQNIPLSSVVVL